MAIFPTVPVTIEQTFSDVSLNVGVAVIYRFGNILVTKYDDMTASKLGNMMLPLS